MYKAFLIKYGEIGVKGKNRYLFEDALVRQIRFALNKIDGDFVVSKENGRIYATAQSEFDYDEAVEALKTVFGIIGICPVVQIEDNGFDDLAEHVIKYLDEAYPDKNVTFKVDARRARKNYPMNSMEINMEMGGRILDAFPEMKVDVHKPEVLLQIEIRKNINIYSIEIPGPGGMPIGTAGKAMLLLSGGIDSPVAGYMIAKRGVQIEATYFHAPPYTSERVLLKITDKMKENFKDMLLESGSGYMMPFALEEKEELPTTLGYGKQRHPMTGEEFNHLGVDFAIKNRDLYAVASGMIVGAGNDALHDNYLLIVL